MAYSTPPPYSQNAEYLPLLPGHSEVQLAAGLDLLYPLDKLVVKKKVKWSWGIGKLKYSILTDKEEKLFFAAEDHASRNWAGSATRPIHMRLIDQSGREIANFTRPLNPSFWSNNFDPRLTVQCPPGQVVGYVVKQKNLFSNEYHIENARGHTMFHLELSSMSYRILSAGRRVKVGKVKSEWSTLKRELLGADTFGVNFPKDMDVNMKMVFLGACIFIATEWVKEKAKC